MTLIEAALTAVLVLGLMVWYGVWAGRLPEWQPPKLGPAKLGPVLQFGDTVVMSQATFDALMDSFKQADGAFRDAAVQFASLNVVVNDLVDNDE